MPFDSKTSDAAINRQLVIDLLRGDFPLERPVWNFKDGDRCAFCEVRRALGSPQIDNTTPTKLGLSSQDFNEIFGLVGSNHYRWYRKERGRVTPAMVAAALERAPFIT